jgi:hypothetical protein
MVILGIEIAMLVMGIAALVKGEAAAGKGRKIKGVRARLMGMAMMMPLPLAFACGVGLGTYAANTGQMEILNYAWLCDVGALLFSVVIAAIVGGKGEEETPEETPENAFATE